MFLHITEAKYQEDYEDYKVEVTLNDGRKRIADSEETLSGKVFEPYGKNRRFSAAFCQ